MSNFFKTHDFFPHSEPTKVVLNGSFGRHAENDLARHGCPVILINAHSDRTKEPGMSWGRSSGWKVLRRGLRTRNILNKLSRIA